VWDCLVWICGSEFWCVWESFVWVFGSEYVVCVGHLGVGLWVVSVCCV